MLRFSTNIKPIGGWVIEALDKFMISDLIDISATGIYAVNYKFGIIYYDTGWNN